MTYVGIDQSYSGFAITFLEEDGEHETVVRGFDPKKFGSGPDRLFEIDTWLTDLLMDYRVDIDHVCMEGYSMSSKFGREKAGELGAVVKMALLSVLGLPAGYPTIVQPTTLKKYVLGVGKGGKNEMLLGVYRRFGVAFQDDNAADSYALARLAEAVVTGHTNYKYEADVVKSLKINTEQMA